MIKKTIQYLETNKKLTYALAIIWTIIIIIGCSLPGKELPKLSLFDHVDKVVHFTFFAVFFIVWFLPTPKQNMHGYRIIGISALFGFAIEWYQLYFVAGRSFDIWDGVFDTLGAIIAYILFKTLYPLILGNK